MAAIGQGSELATSRKPGGRVSTRSPWLIHTDVEVGSPSNSSLFSASTVIRAWPYSPP